MRFLKVLLIVVALLAALVWGGGMLLSPKFTVIRSVEIQAPPEQVYALVADPKAWQQWSAWNRRDPEMQMSFSGEPVGAGAGWAWRSKSQGNGRMAFIAADPNRKLDYDLQFEDFEATSKGSFIFEPIDGGTRVSWTLNGDMGDKPPMRWFALGADYMIGPDFEAGLRNLKSVAEKK
ncbi:SRPBCC family protein [Piscinibacter sakaiensis]|uniref:SRPBCC family protein n=1 Tax=Piscinibacter sakaiensis TaxID=1547922 RepID=UPI003AB06ADA